MPGVMKSNWMSSNGIKEKRGERLRQTESAGGGRAKTTMIKWTLAAVIIGFLIDLAWVIPGGFIIRSGRSAPDRTA